MNSLYTLGVRQTNSLQTDLERLRNGDNSPPLLGQISASLAAMHRTIDDYDSMAKREIIKAKQEKAQMRVQKFRADYTEMRTQFEQYKTSASNEEANSRRTDLLSSTSIAASSTPNSFNNDSRRRHNPSSFPPHQQHLQDHSESPFRQNQAQMQAQYAALDEHTFLQNTEARLDEFLSQGREVLDNLVDQRKMLKGTHRRLLDAANTLGLSKDVIGWIERRSTQDIYIFLGGAVFTFFCFYLIWKYLD